jgi:chemotaxis protein histidine kinase CheA
MDRIALSKRIGGLADVFANGSPIRRELEAMSYALEHMQDEKFSSILNAGYEADDKDANVRGFGVAQPVQKPTLAIQERARAQTGKPDVPVFEPRDPKAALEALMSDPQVAEIIKKNPKLTQVLKEAGIEIEADLTNPEGNTWNREASDAVIRNLISDVLGKEAMEKAICCDTGRQLEKKQMPDAEKKQEKPATLTDPQTPKLSESLKSDMYKKSQGAVRKEAAKKDEAVVDAPVTEEDAPKAEEAPEAPKAEEVPVAKQMAEEKAEKKVEKTQEQATDTAEDTAKALKKLEKMTDKKASEEAEAMLSFDGIELGSPMGEVELTDEDRNTLGKLFG